MIRFLKDRMSSISSDLYEEILKLNKSHANRIIQIVPCNTVLEVVEVKIANVENSNYKIINALAVVINALAVLLMCTYLKYLKLSDSSDSNFNCYVDILISADYYWDFVSGNIKRRNSGPVAVETILGWVLSGT